MQEQRLAFLGFGNVGRALARLLLEKRSELRDRYRLDWRVVGIATGHHGMAFDPQGIDLEKALFLVEAGGDLERLSKRPALHDGVAFVQACQAEVLFENTPVNYQTGQPAVDHIRAALEAGMHVLTANKGPVVHAYRELTDLALSHDRRFFFESTVMDGVPVFALWREALPGANLQSFRGLLNSTTNLILSLMEEGKSFGEAVSHAQNIGIAETDPSGDTQGWDAAIKVAALVTVIMGLDLKPQEVDRQGIEGISREEVLAARQHGKRWKLVCSAENLNGEIRAKVHPERVGPDDPLYNVMGTSSAITFYSDALAPLTLMESGAGPETTAYGLLADFLNAVRR